MSTRRPNILLIMADDLGYSDIGPFGAEIATPHLDDLARRGVRQTQFYNCARCCPTRAALVTGVYPHRAGVGGMVHDRGPQHPGYRGFIRPDLPTIAERLRAAGYRTWMSGKWHCGGSYKNQDPQQWRVAGDPAHPLPTQRGFQRFYGILTGAGSYFDPRTLMDQDRFIAVEDLPDDYYITDELGRRAAGFIDEAAAGGQPFFGYLAFTAPHWPLHAPEADIAPYRGRYACGWDELRRRRLRRLVDEGLLPSAQALSRRDASAVAWDEAPEQAWQAELMAVYAAQVTAMDRAIGMVMEALRRHGAFDDTLIVFCSDNGGCAEYLGEEGLSHGEKKLYNLPTKDSTPCRMGNDRNRLPGPAETFMSYELPWANASNTPFRKFKIWTHEGGISSPLVVSWPRGLPAGRVVHGQGHIIDLGATACALAGAAGDGLDGCDLLPVWRDGAERSGALYWEHEGHAAVREGSWKLVRDRDRPWELYDIGSDRIEEDDLAARQPELVARLAEAWKAWADEVGVFS